MRAKTIVIIIASISFSGSHSFGQGTIAFANSSTTLVMTNDGAGHSGPAGLTTATGIKVALFYQPDPVGSTVPLSMEYTFNQGNWEQIATLANISPQAGRFSGGQVVTGSDVAPAGNVWLEVVAWDGNQTTLAGALANSAFIGFSRVWSQGTGDGGPVGAVPIIPGFTGIPPVPEPSTIALGGLGAATLLLVRRRK